MRFWFKCTMVAISVSALTSAVLAPASLETAMSIDNNTYLVPLYESCPAGSSTCGTIDGTYLVMLRKGYNPSSHLSFITENLHIDPVEEWQLKWFNEQHYIASDVSMDLLNLLRQDSGIEGIEEGSWFEMVEVDRCQNSAFSEDETKQCYDAGPFDACKNEILSEDEMWICVHKTMQFRIKFAIVVVAIFAISHHCLASTSKAKALSGDDVDYLAPLINDCWDDDPMCGVKEGKFTIHLHEEHKSSHLESIQRIVHVDPFKDWGLEWHDDQTYTVSHISKDSVNRLRRDPGVEEVEQSYWFRPALVDPCRKPRLSENERRSCYKRSEAEELEHSAQREMNEL